MTCKLRLGSIIALALAVAMPSAMLALELCSPAEKTVDVVAAQPVAVSSVPRRLVEETRWAGRDFEGTGTTNTSVKILSAALIELGGPDQPKPTYILTLEVTGGSLKTGEKLLRKGLYGVWGKTGAAEKATYPDGFPPYFWEDDWFNASFGTDAKPYYVDEEGWRRTLYVFKGEIRAGQAAEFWQAKGDTYSPGCELKRITPKVQR